MPRTQDPTAARSLHADEPADPAEPLPTWAEGMPAAMVEQFRACGRTELPGEPTGYVRDLSVRMRAPTSRPRSRARGAGAPAGKSSSGDPGDSDPDPPPPPPARAAATSRTAARHRAVRDGWARARHAVLDEQLDDALGGA